MEKINPIIGLVLLLGSQGFFAIQKLPAEGILLEDFETTDWVWEGAEGNTIKTLLAPGKEGKALQVDYDLKSKQWVQWKKDISIPNYEGNTLQFYMKVLGEKKNNLEIKLIDNDGTNFGYKIVLIPLGEWKRIEIALKDFSYWWGGDSTLSEVKQMYFAVSHIQGGKGSVILDDLRAVKSPPEQRQ